MYLVPQTTNLQEFIERLEQNETFRVFKRPVAYNTKDRTFKRHGRSNVVLEDGTEVIVQILNGKIIQVVPLNDPIERVLTPRERKILHAEDLVPKRIFKPDTEESFKDLLKHMDKIEQEYGPKPDMSGETNNNEK